MGFALAFASLALPAFRFDIDTIKTLRAAPPVWCNHTLVLPLQLFLLQCSLVDIGFWGFESSHILLVKLLVVISTVVLTRKGIRVPSTSWVVTLDLVSRSMMDYVVMSFEISRSGENPWLVVLPTASTWVKTRMMLLVRL